MVAYCITLPTNRVEPVRLVKRRNIQRLLICRGEPIYSLPAELGTIYRTRFLQFIIQRRTSNLTSSLSFLVWPMEFVVSPVTLQRTLFQIRRFSMKPSESSYIERPEIKRRASVNDPLRHGSTRTTRSCDSSSEPTCNVKIISTADQPHHRLTIGADWNGAINQGLNSEFLDDRQSSCCQVKNLTETIIIAVVQGTCEVCWECFAVNCCRIVFPTTELERAGLWLEIEISIRVSQCRQTIRNLV